MRSIDFKSLPQYDDKDLDELQHRWTKNIALTNTEIINILD